MNRWWDINYPFRRQLKFTNSSHPLDSNSVLLAYLPSSLEDQGKLVNDNFAVVFNNREIAKPVPASIETLGPYTVVTLHNIVEIGANQEQDSYYLYYGRRDTYPGYNEPLDIDGVYDAFAGDASFSYVEQNNWTVLDSGYATTVQDSKFILNLSLTTLDITFLVAPEFTGTARVKIDDEEWVYLRLLPDNLELDNYREFVYTLNVGEQDNRNIRTVTIETVKADLSDFTIGDMSSTDVPKAGEDPAIQVYFDETQSNTGMFIKSINYVPFASMQVQSEEVTEALPWSSKLGGTVNAVR